MKHLLIVTASIIYTLSLASPLYAKPILDCNHTNTLNQTVARAEAGETVMFTGTCSGPITIIQDNITLQGQGTAIIDGQHQTAVTLRGAQNVKLTSLEVRHGGIGILVDAQAYASLENVLSHDNDVFGIALQNHSGATFKGVITRNNTVYGMDVESSSAATMNGQFTAEDNGVFGINISNGSSLTLRKTQLIAQRNLLGIQLGTAAQAFISDADSSIHVMNNISTGLTVVSGSQLVSFGGTIIADGNGRNGVSVNSKAGLDLDAASLLESSNNGGNGLQLAESSVLTLFNTTAFSGATGNTTVKTHGNGSHGIAVLSGSTFTAVNQVDIQSQNNIGAGFLADNGSTVTLLKSTFSNNATDVLLTFGVRADIQKSTFTTIRCDATVLLRGDVASCTSTLLAKPLS